MKTRVESDLLGQIEIDDSKYFGIHTYRALQNFKISNTRVSDYPLFIKSLVLTKKACALANGELGTIGKEQAAMIVGGCDQILTDVDKYAWYFPTDVFQGGAGTSVNMNANEVIANVALELFDQPKGKYELLNPNDHVNKCQSTNDVYPSAFRVALHLYMTDLLEKIEVLIGSLNSKAVAFKQVLKMGRTQLQDAVPMSLGDEFEAWATNLREDIKSLTTCRDLILELNLGGTAIGTGLNAPEQFSQLAIDHLNALTGITFIKAENLIEATSDCGAYVMISGGLKRTAVKLSKICNDLRLLSSGPRCGLNEINLPEMQAGSSIMPAKVNPVIPEVANQVCFKIIGNDVTVSFAAEAGQLQLNVMEPVIVQALFESIELLGNASTTLAEKCIDGITANADLTAAMVYNSVGIITFLNPYIGHEMGDQIGKEAIRTGKSIRELVLEKQLLTKEELDQILSIDNLMNPSYKANLHK